MKITRSPLLVVGWLAVSSAACGGSNSVPTSTSTTGAEQVAVSRSHSDDGASGEPWQSVANPRARYIVAIGEPTARISTVRPSHLAHARAHAARTLQSIDEVELAPARFDRATLSAASVRRNLGGLVLECAVVRHSVDARGTHIGVNIAVVDLRTVNVLATLTGGATAPGPTSADAEELAIEGALDSAFRGLPRLLSSLGDRSVASLR